MTDKGPMTILMETRMAAVIEPNTIMQKLLLPSIAEMHLGNMDQPGRFEAHRTAGFLVRGGDVAAVNRAGAVEVTRAYGMDKVAGWPVGGPAYVLRFHACWPGLYHNAFGAADAETAAKIGGGAVYPAPFLGLAFTNYKPAPIPEYFMHQADLVAGTEMWRIDPDGTERMVGKYSDRQRGWYRMPEATTFGPAAYFAPPVPLTSRVRRGLIATYRGTEFVADFGPGPLQVTLHPWRGQPAPDGFQERASTYSLTVDRSECDELQYVQLLATYKDAVFDVMDASKTHVVLNYVGENYHVAQELNLDEVDYRVWRTVVPRDQVTQWLERIAPI